MESPQAAQTSLFGLLNKNLFSKSDAFTTIIGMQFMTAFITLIFEPLMLWLMPDESWGKINILLPDKNNDNDAVTTIQLAPFVRKVLMLIVVIVSFHYLL
jgi:hypothetical protein